MPMKLPGPWALVGLLTVRLLFQFQQGTQKIFRMDEGDGLAVHVLSLRRTDGHHAMLTQLRSGRGHGVHVQGHVMQTTTLSLDERVAILGKNAERLLRV